MVHRFNVGEISSGLLLDQGSAQVVGVIALPAIGSAAGGRAAKSAGAPLMSEACRGISGTAAMHSCSHRDHVDLGRPPTSRTVGRLALLPVVRPAPSRVPGPRCCPA